MEVIDLPTRSLVQAETAAIRDLAGWLATPEGQEAGDTEIALWLTERGWHPSKYRAWAERIAAEKALADPQSSNPLLIHARLDHRFERLAHKAEGNNDLKHAIEATKAQAQLNKVGGFAPAASATVAIQVNASTAHLVSDEDLAKIAASAKPASGDKDGDLWE